jgi:hypothetical protein
MQILPNDTRERLKLWLQTSATISIAENQGAKIYRIAKLAAEHTASATTEQNMVRGNACQNQPPWLNSTIRCMFSHCTPQQKGMTCLLEKNNGDKHAKQGKPRHQLILGGYITEKVNHHGVLDSGDYFVVLGHRIYTSGGINGNGGTDRTTYQIPKDAWPGFNRHFIQQDIYDIFPVGSYVYLSCTIDQHESMSCGLDSSNQRAMVTTSKASSDAWMPN